VPWTLTPYWMHFPMVDEIVHGAAAVAILVAGFAVAWFFYQKAQAQAQNAASVALNNQYFQQQIQTQQLQELTGTLNGSSAVTAAAGISALGSQAAVPS
jgi:predicted negative regulator of RcsB-dependent stress response